MFVFILIFIIVSIIVCVIIANIQQKKCPHCKMRNALEETDRQCIKTEKVSKIEELKRRDKNGNVIGTRESRVYGTRQTYQITYVCKFCHNTCVRSETKDIY